VCCVCVRGCVVSERANVAKRAGDIVVFVCVRPCV